MEGRSHTKAGGPWLVVAALIVVGLGAVDPLGWDRFGPIRWALLPALGFGAVAARWGDLNLGLNFGRDSDLGRGLGFGSWLGAWPQLGWGALLTWGALASATAVDPLHAWIGTPDRRFGWLIWALCGGLFLLAISAGHDSGNSPGSTGGDTAAGSVRLLLAKAFVVGSLAIGLSLLVDSDLWRQGLFELRLGGPFGQPAYLGAAAALTLPVCLGLAAAERPGSGWRVAAGCGAATALLALLASGSRAAWLGSLAAAALWSARPASTAASIPTAASATGPSSTPAVGTREAEVGPVDRGGGWRFVPVVGNRSAASGLRAASMLLVAAVLVGVPGLRDRLTTATGDGGVIQGRLDEWQVGLRALAERPVLGYGPEGYRTVFGANVDPQYVMDWGREVITDRAHNGLLDVALSFGVVGAVIYGGLLLLVMRAAWRALASVDPVLRGLAAGVVAYGVQQQFLFPLSELDPLFWLAAGSVVAGSAALAGHGPGHDPIATGLSTAPPSTAPPDTAPPRTAPPRTAPLSVGRSMGRGLVAGVAMVTAVAGGLDLVANARLDGAIENDDVAAVTGLRPESTRYHFIAASVARRNGDLERSLQHLNDGLRFSPDDPGFLQLRATVLLQRARATSVGPERDRALAEAVTELGTLIEDDPHHPALLEQQGVALALSGRLAEAETSLMAAIELAPDSESARTNLAEVRRLGDDSP